MIPNGLVSLERHFDAKDVPKNVIKKNWEDGDEHYNIGTKK